MRLTPPFSISARRGLAQLRSAGDVASSAAACWFGLKELRTRLQFAWSDRPMNLFEGRLRQYARTNDEVDAAPPRRLALGDDDASAQLASGLLRSRHKSIKPLRYTIDL